VTFLMQTLKENEDDGSKIKKLRTEQNEVA
jgi:hypothetical protein